MLHTTIAPETGALNPTGALSAPALGFVPMPAVAAVLSRYSGDQIASFIEVAIGLLDVAEGDPDREDATDLEDDFSISPIARRYAEGGPGCKISDDGDISATEWHTRGRDKLSPGINCKGGWSVCEDTEDDDPDTGLDEGEPNFVTVRAADGPGCAISDPDFCLAGDDRIGSGSLTRAMLLCEDNGPGDADDAEREQMPGDVPTLPVHALEPNIFTGEREFLGFSNLLSSYQGQKILSADTGKRHSARPAVPGNPGVPV